MPSTDKTRADSVMSTYTYCVWLCVACLACVVTPTTLSSQLSYSGTVVLFNKRSRSVSAKGV
eukprot:2630236-Prymnesium_polylepis.1